MTLMEFQTKIVESNKNPKARIAWGGGIVIALSMILMCMDRYQHYGFWLFGVGVAVLVVGALVAKGDVDVMELSDTDMVVNLEEILVGETVYPLAQVSGIEFQVEGYDGMVDRQGYSSSDVPLNRMAGLVNGMNNYLDFSFGGEKVEWQFYLADPQHVQQLGELFKEFYAKGIPFHECSQVSKRTFLFEPVSEKEWEDRMIVNGYRYSPQ